MDNIRDKFPILDQKIHGKSLVYLDNGATTQKPIEVVDTIVNAYYTCNANIHRGVHTLSQKATEAHEVARQKIADSIGAKSSKEIFFTRGTTEAINLVAHSFCSTFCKEGDEIILTEMEHHSNIVPWQLIADRIGLSIKVAKVQDNGELDLDYLYSLISDKTKILSIAHVSNVLGTINPVKEIISVFHKNNIAVLVDGAQAVPHHKINVTDLDCDFYTFSGHKMYAPNGIGALYGKEELMNAMTPYQGGGEMIDSVSFEKTTFNELPYKFEAGTPDYIGSLALAKAFEFINNIGYDEVEKHEKSLMEYATKRLLEREDVKIIGTAKNKSGVISFLVDGVHHYDLGMILDKMGVAIRTGHHCAQPLMKRFDISGTARMSFAVYNTKEEIDYFIDSLNKALSILK